MSWLKFLQAASSKLAKREGKKSQVKRADIVEILKLLVEEQIECGDNGEWDKGILHKLFVRADEKSGG